MFLICAGVSVFIKGQRYTVDMSFQRYNRFSKTVFQLGAMWAVSYPVIFSDFFYGFSFGDLQIFYR